jgi:hypothetical protein
MISEAAAAISQSCAVRLATMPLAAASNAIKPTSDERRPSTLCDQPPTTLSTGDSGSSQPDGARLTVIRVL